jgi:hypothetical protein
MLICKILKAQEVPDYNASLDDTKRICIYIYFIYIYMYIYLCLCKSIHKH